MDVKSMTTDDTHLADDTHLSMPGCQVWLGAHQGRTTSNDNINTYISLLTCHHGEWRVTTLSVVLCHSRVVHYVNFDIFNLIYCQHPGVWLLAIVGRHVYKKSNDNTWILSHTPMLAPASADLTYLAPSTCIKCDKSANKERQHSQFRKTTSTCHCACFI